MGNLAKISVEVNECKFKRGRYTHTEFINFGNFHSQFHVCLYDEWHMFLFQKVHFENVRIKIFM
jgi:hypothetical protein